MSTPNSCDTNRSIEPSGEPAPSRAFVRMERRLRAVLQAVSFWAAVLLPFVAVGYLASGLTSTGEWSAFVSLLVASGFALYLGHSYCLPRLSA
jgi:hypothetical protein